MSAHELSVYQVAYLCRTTPDKVRRWAKSGRGATVRKDAASRQWRFTSRDVELFQSEARPC